MSRFNPKLKLKKKDKDFSELYKLESNIKVTFEDSSETTTMSEERRKALNRKGMNIQPIITPSIIKANTEALKEAFFAKQAALDAKNKEAEDIKLLRLVALNQAKAKAETIDKEKTEAKAETIDKEKTEAETIDKEKTEDEIEIEIKIKEREAKKKAKEAEIKEKKKIEAENKAKLKAKEKEDALAKFQKIRAETKSKVNNKSNI
jgi:hypothetical protein